MNNVVAITKNVKRLMVSVGALEGRSLNVEGMSLLEGRTGTGKTWASGFVVNRVNGVFVRAKGIWTETGMLADIMSELGAEPLGRKRPMFNFIVERLMATDRALFIDESNYLDVKLLDLVRDIYDSSRAPVILIGETGLRGKLARNGRFMRRVTQEIEFTAVDMEDARTVTDSVCEVEVAGDLLEKLHKEAKGEVGLIANGLNSIETFAKTNNKEKVDLGTWGERKLFFRGRR